MRNISSHPLVLFLGLITFACNEDDTVFIRDISQLEIRLNDPVDNTVDVSTSTTFSWDTLGIGVRYKLVVGVTPTFDSEPVLEIENIQDSIYTAELDYGTRYYWRLVASNNVDEQLESEIRSFRTAFAAPSPSPNTSTYYVSPSGMDEPDAGTEAKPFKTLFYASKMVPHGEGDVIQLATGIYQEIEEIRIPLGVSVVGQGVESTILRAGALETFSEEDFNDVRFKSSPRGSLIQLVSEFRSETGDLIPPADGNQQLSGFSIDGSDKTLKAAIWIQNRNHVTLQNIQIKDCAQRGIVVSRGTNSNTSSAFIKGLTISHVKIENSAVDLQDETLGNLCLGGLDGAKVHDVQIEDDQGYGIKFIFRGYFVRCEFFDIKTQLNEFDAKWTEDAAIELWNLGPGNRVYNVESNTWHSYINDPGIYTARGASNNLEMFNLRVIDQDGNNTDRGIEMAVPHSELADSYIQDKGFGVAIWETARQNLTIRNSIFYNTTFKNNFTGGTAIFIANSKPWDYDDIRIINNVFERHNYGVRVQGERVLDVLVRNNLFVDIRTKDVDNSVFQARVGVSHNFKASTEDSLAWVLDGVSAADNLFGDPMIESAGDRWESYYKPQAGSPLIDAGIDVGIPFQGDAPDIGAYEVNVVGDYQP
ncbi:MAG: DUF1565 domain-containing protein [Cyclobacteriaceae bacterium]|nr:DUF1565 domain-containing protein [Cyclobacteriaceae bacterium HetDA_MAG_MS6]